MDTTNRSFDDWLAILKKDGLRLKDVPRDYPPFEREMLERVAVERNGLALEFVPTLNRTINHIIPALKQNINAGQFIDRARYFGDGYKIWKETGFMDWKDFMDMTEGQQEEAKDIIIPALLEGRD